MNSTLKRNYRLSWWKILSIILLFYTLLAGFLVRVPRQPIVHESIRNQYFHVCMWFAMIILMLLSTIYSIRYLRNNNEVDDMKAAEAANAGMLFGILGLVTGMLWAGFTWNEFWNNDPKQICAAIGLLVYFAYFILRGSFTDEQQKGRISAIYNIFSFPVLIALLYIIPRQVKSLHPGDGGNPGFNIYDLDNKMRMIFYPAIIGWTLLGVWIASLRVEYRKIENKVNEYNN